MQSNIFEEVRVLFSKKIRVRRIGVIYEGIRKVGSRILPADVDTRRGKLW